MTTIEQLTGAEEVEWDLSDLYESPDAEQPVGPKHVSGTPTPRQKLPGRRAL